MTAIYILLDTKNGTLHYVNAAHPSGFIWKIWRNSLPPSEYTYPRTIPYYSNK